MRNRSKKGKGPIEHAQDALKISQDLLELGGRTVSTYKSKNIKAILAAFLIPVSIGLTLAAFRTSGDERTITIIADGQAIHMTTDKNFVGDALRSAKIEFDQDDIIMPPAMATITEGEVITVKKVERVTEERETVIPFTTVTLPNRRLRVGSEVELRAGCPGIRRDVVEVEKINGVVTREESVRSEVAMQPISRKIYLGTRTTGSTVSKMRMQATAYTAGAESCWPSVDGMTAVLKQAGYGVAAVDPRVISLGTRLYIEGYGFAVASDVGGAIKGNRIDLFIADLQTARAFGRRQVNVYLLD